MREVTSSSVTEVTVWNAVANTYRKWSGGDDIQYGESESFSWWVRLKFVRVEMWLANRIRYQICGGLFFAPPTFGVVCLDLGQMNSNQKMLSDVSFADDMKWLRMVSLCFRRSSAARRSFSTLRTSRWISQKMAKHWVTVHAPGLYWPKCWLGVEEKLGPSLLCWSCARVKWKTFVPEVYPHTFANIAFERIGTKFFGCWNCSGDLKLLREADEDWLCSV